ncbi:MAG TPA: YbaK/EbsC family protein [Nocardioidaceae bacterium]|nr:YbaK/EbsC family protein [Nocardioidaceae bacterium]
MIGRLETMPAREHPELLAATVTSALAAGQLPGAEVVEIDPEYADTAKLAEAYDVPMEVSANCVLVTGRRAGVERHAACVVLAHTRADVNNVVRRRLDARKASFAPAEFATEATGMEYGGITPVGLPDDWPVYVDTRVVDSPYVVIGSGVRGSKLVVAGKALADLPHAEVVDGLATPA